MQPDWKEIADVALDSILAEFEEEIRIEEEMLTQEEIREELERFTEPVA